MSNQSEYPLVTFALFAYNQEKYVREAIEGAFAQTYEPLEIILSDDCSSDRTFEIMQQAASEYRGPHTIRLNRNSENLSIGGHVNMVNRLARGELVIAAAGDDVSLPNRANRLVNAWLETNKLAGMLHSSRYFITENGEMLGEYPCDCLDALTSVESAEIADAFVAGATEAWDKNLFDLFGDFRTDLIHEDCALMFRSLLAKRPIAYVEQPLVNYRAGVGVTDLSNSAASRRDPLKRTVLLGRLRTVTQQKMDDLRVIPNPLLLGILKRKLARQDVAIQFEHGFPAPVKFAKLMRSAGFYCVARNSAKRIVNILLD